MTKVKKRTSNWKKTVFAVAGTIAIVAGSASVAKRNVVFGERVTGITDGDTFVISSGQPIRLYGIDAPEIQYCFGQKSKEALGKQILGKKVMLKEPMTDRYGRIMALVYLNDKLINEFMVKNGYARSQGQGESEIKRILDANNFARENNLGIYSSECYQKDPQKPKCLIKGNFSETLHEKFYLMPGCTNYSNTIVEKFQGEDWFCTEKDAQKAGYKKSGNCK